MIISNIVSLSLCVLEPIFSESTIASVKAGKWFLTFSSSVNCVEFSDANAKFYCRIYYAEEFHKMREVIMESAEEDFVRSLSHCVNWQARGGKSGAVFYATEGRSVFFKMI